MGLKNKAGLHRHHRDKNGNNLDGNAMSALVTKHGKAAILGLGMLGVCVVSGVGQNNAFLKKMVLSTESDSGTQRRLFDNMVDDNQLEVMCKYLNPNITAAWPMHCCKYQNEENNFYDDNFRNNYNWYDDGYNDDTSLGAGSKSGLCRTTRGEVELLTCEVTVKCDDEKVTTGSDWTFSLDDDTLPWENPDSDSYCASGKMTFATNECYESIEGSSFSPAIAVLALLGCFYLFIFIAIVCDELFVPALEQIAEAYDMSNDIAGATLMAAGGSAPELATSLIGCFADSTVGFGTIVGSAVFNVAFVIGSCVIFTPKKFLPLKLTWWPLARDCTYYLITLVTLYLFFMDSAVEWWEALIQFMLYWGYVLIMSQNSKLENWVESKLGAKKEEAAPVNEVQEANGEKVEQDETAIAVVGAPAGRSRVVSVWDPFSDQGPELNRPSTFRAGVLTLLTSNKPLGESFGVSCVSRIKGDVNETFRELDKDNSGYIDSEELTALLAALGIPDITTAKISEFMSELDRDKDGKIDKDEFTIWYIKSESRIKAEMKRIFDKIDVDDSKSISRDEMHDLLIDLGIDPHDENKELEDYWQLAGDGGLSFEEFEKWYTNSMFFKQATDAAEGASEACQGMWANMVSQTEELSNNDISISTKLSIIFTLPITFILAVTVPDCRVPGREKWKWTTFLMAIVHIMWISYALVFFVEGICGTVKIPTFIAGLTFLAAGTSIPDLLSSIIVAQHGQGDMAVSSSIGSNIFDVAVGLPLPWLLFSAIVGCPKQFDQCENIAKPLLILIFMVFAIIGSIAASGFKMTHMLGYMMFAGYFLFMVEEIIFAYVTPLRNSVCPASSGQDWYDKLYRYSDFFTRRGCQCPSPADPGC